MEIEHRNPAYLANGNTKFCCTSSPTATKSLAFVTPIVTFSAAFSISGSIHREGRSYGDSPNISSAPQSWQWFVNCLMSSKFSTPIYKLCIIKIAALWYWFWHEEIDWILPTLNEGVKSFFSSDDTTAIMVKYSSNTVWDIIILSLNFCYFVATPTWFLFGLYQRL